jgi:signal peptidase I
MSSVTLPLEPARGRSRIVAGLLSLLAPGVGHLYAGHARRGIALFAAFIVLQPILIAAAYLLAPTFRALSLFAVAVIVTLFLLYLFIVIDAVRLARRGAGTRWYVWLGAIGVVWAFWYAVGLLNPAIKSLVPWQTFSVASTSMQPTLRIGEWLIADKGWFATHAPARGDVIIYRLPSDNTTIYIKRVVALGGDRIVFRDNRAVVNGVAADEPYADIGDPNSFFANTPEVTVPADHLFVAGDNRANSSDSRVKLHGTVPVKNLVARATEIFMTDDWQRAGTWIGSAQ